MKNQLQKIFAAAILFLSTATTAFSTIHTVDNKANSSADFANLQTAIDAASSGDTLYVEGSPNMYGSVVITKKLAIIGAGYRSSNTQLGFATVIGPIQYDEGEDEFGNPVSDPSGSYLTGINLWNAITIVSGTNYLMERNWMALIQLNPNTSAVLRNNIIESVWLYNHLASVMVQNSIIWNGIYSTNASSNVIFDHCLFLNNALTNTNAQYITINNSIMFNISTDGLTYSTFNNNISFAGADGIFVDFAYGTNTSNNNLVDVDPLFSTIDGVTFSFTDDYRLKEGSPAIGAGSDGTDIGIYGGLFPFPIGGEGEYLMTAAPKIPQIYEMNVLNAAVPENGTLNVQVKARKQN